MSITNYPAEQVRGSPLYLLLALFIYHISAISEEEIEALLHTYPAY